MLTKHPLSYEDVCFAGKYWAGHSCWTTPSPPPSQCPGWPWSSKDSQSSKWQSWAWTERPGRWRAATATALTGLRIKINNTLKSLYLNADAVDNNDDEPNLCCWEQLGRNMTLLTVRNTFSLNLSNWGDEKMTELCGPGRNMVWVPNKSNPTFPQIWGSQLWCRNWDSH